MCSCVLAYYAICICCICPCCLLQLTALHSSLICSLLYRHVKKQPTLVHCNVQLTLFVHLLLALKLKYVCTVIVLTCFYI